MTDIKEAQGLEVIGFHCMDSAGIETLEWRGGSYADEPLCSLPKAQAIIEHLQETIASFEEGSERMAIKGIEMRLELDQQAARIAELQLDADRYRWLWLEANSTYGIDYRQRPELTLPIYAPDHREGLDAAIDAAMGSEE